MSSTRKYAPGRTVKEWVAPLLPDGTPNPDTRPPASVVARLYKQQNGLCPKSGIPIAPGRFIIEHVKPLSMGGENRESNLELWDASQSRDKTAREASTRAKADRVLQKHLGVKRSHGAPLPGTKRSGIRKRMNGTIERYNEETGQWEPYR